MSNNRRKQQKVDLLGTRNSDFAVRVVIYIVMFIIAAIIYVAGHGLGW